MHLNKKRIHSFEHKKSIFRTHLDQFLASSTWHVEHGTLWSWDCFHLIFMEEKTNNIKKPSATITNTGVHHHIKHVMQLQYNILNVHSWTCSQKTFSNSCSHKVFFKTQQHDKKSKEFRTKIAWGKAVTTVLAFLWTPHGLVYDRFQLFSMCKWSV